MLSIDILPPIAYRTLKIIAVFQTNGHKRTHGHIQTHDSKKLAVCQITGHMQTHGHTQTHDSKNFSCVSNNWSHADTWTHTDK